MSHLPGGRKAGLALVVACGLAGAAVASPPTPAAAGVSSASDDSHLGALARRHAIYLELFGKGGLWGLGYDFALSKHFAVGAVGSFYVLGGDRYLTFSPYVTAYPVMGEHHRWFVELGPQAIRRSTPSPVPEWNGMSTTALGGEVSSGWEYRNHLLVRVYAMLAIGDRAAPWVGASVGWTL